MINWNLLVEGLLSLQRQAAAVFDEPGFSRPPNPSATVAAIVAAEKRLGVIFDDSFRRFQLTCNGWSRFGAVHLFGVDEIGRSEKWHEGSATVRADADRAVRGVPETERHRLVLVGKAAVTDRFIAVRFPTDTSQRAGECVDDNYGECFCYSSFEEWAEFESASIATALREEIAIGKRQGSMLRRPNAIDK